MKQSAFEVRTATELTPNTMDVIIALSIFLFSLLLVVGLRKRIGKNYEIKNTDILIGLIPLALWLLLTGKISSFEYGDLKIATAFQKANSTSISESITDIYKSNIRQAEKGTFDQLRRVLATKPEALIFHSGEGRYDPYIIEQYIKTLAASTLKYLIIMTEDNAFIGIIPIETFMAQTQGENPKFQPAEFATWLNEGDNVRIANIEGMLDLEDSVTPQTSKHVALQKMQQIGTKFLPVTGNKQFQGIIEMDQLSTSLLMDISESLVGETK